MITMTIPRKTSTETNRGGCEGRKESFVLTVATVGEATAVTMPRISAHMLISCSSVYVSGGHRLVDSWDVNRLQLMILESVTSLIVTAANSSGRMSVIGR